MSHHQNTGKIDQAIAARLAKLADRPVDTSELAHSLELAMKQAENQDAGQDTSHAPSLAPKPIALCIQRWWRPLSTSAAAILIALTLGWLILANNPSRAYAAPAELAQIHFDVAHGLSPHMTVSTLAQANTILAEQSSDHRPLPPIPGELQSCCLHHHAGTTITCVMIKQQDQLITIALADGSKIRSPQGQVVTRNGHSFITHKVNGINMVMADQSGQWLCVMSEAPFDQLIEVASNILTHEK